MCDYGVNFSGIVHDHKWSPGNNSPSGAASCPTIAILKRHPMYDCLILVKKFRNCLNGYALEFPLVNCEDLGEKCSTGGANCDNHVHDLKEQDENKHSCRRKMVSRYLDGDDPWKFGPIIDQNQYLDDATRGRQSRSADLRNQDPNEASSCSFMSKYPPQKDDLGQICELVTVPINGLLDRLQLYTESGVSVDSKVYAFAMGLKTAERILTRSSMQEVSETPPI